MDKLIKLENVHPYNELYGLETLHPLISVIDLTKATKTVNHYTHIRTYPISKYPQILPAKFPITPLGN